MAKDVINKLLSCYEKACNAILQAFSKKYGVEVDEHSWVLDDVASGVICVNEEFYMNLEEIILMLKEDISFDVYLAYWDYCLTTNYLGLETMNFKSWVHGAPRYSKEALDKIKALREELEELADKSVDEVNGMY